MKEVLRTIAAPLFCIEHPVESNCRKIEIYFNPQG